MGRNLTSILFVSNGYGEDMISKALIRKIGPKGFKTMAIPLVGKGAGLKGANLEVVGPRMDLPSGGFPTRSMRYLVSDLLHGLPILLYLQIRQMQRIRREVDLVVCIGDIYPVILCSIFIKRPILFIATYKSTYTGGYLWIERAIMKRCCRMVFARDGPTAEHLSVDGIRASFVGNPIMDCIPEILPTPKQGGYTIGLLPGSREEAYLNLRDMLRKVEVVFRLLKGEEVSFVVSIAHSLSIERVGMVLPSGWRLTGDKILNSALGIGVKMVSFGELLGRSHLVIGLAGTANEQAAGLGRPLVTFPGHGPQTTPRRMEEQRRLLGSAVSLVKNRDDVVAREVLRILMDEKLAKGMGEEGRRRMGRGGGVEEIASLIVEYVEQNLEGKS
jgi:uncharacterized protein (TIGR03492 family)